MSLFDRSVPYLILRIGVAFAFLYPPYAALIDSYSWLAYFPGFVHSWDINQLLLLHGFGILEVVIALWLLSGYRIVIPATLATLMLLGIVVFSWADLDVLFRDLSIAAASLALAIDAWQKPVNKTLPQS